MCGIAGVVGRADAETLKRMGEAIRHRGPDAHGAMTLAEGQVHLVHRRLSILDLSPAGAQPMSSRDGRWCLSFNGEIYNVEELRASLPGPWRGHSDTEVLVEAIAAWGVARALKACVGMFALAAYDKSERKLFLARDRMGEKPLYYGTCGKTFLFGSELRALRAHPDFRGEVDKDALAAYFALVYVPEPLSIYRGIRKLPAAHFLEVDVTGRHGNPVPYWNMRDVVPFTGSHREAVERLEKLLGDAVAKQMVADVPLGAFLSGGIDSSVITALMAARGDRVRTFTIGFDEPGHDESGPAEAVARHLKTDHTTVRLTGKDALAEVPDLARVYDEPFADSSQLPTILVTRTARAHVTVALSGDGADELFGGYNRHVLSSKIMGIPGMLRFMGSAVLHGMPDGLLNRASAKRAAQVRKLAGALAQGSWAELYRYYISTPDHASVLPLPDTHGVDGMMERDLLEYLPGDILTKVDRASMAVSLEVRAPFLDHRVVEFARSLPLSSKVHGGVGKCVLRDVLARHVPRALTDRPKSGFEVPLDRWLRGELRPWAEELLRPESFSHGLFDPTLALHRWHEHQKGKGLWHHQLWAVLQFQQWYREWA